jgi:hypothetical protein
MTDPWPMQLVIDARNMDTIRVRPRRFDTGPQVHLTIRTGPLLVYCLDGKAVQSIAAAWAQAQACSAHLLPPQSSPVPPATRSHRDRSPRRGHAFAASDVVAEGYQRWDVTAPTPSQQFTVVTTEWLTVRVHDRPALETYTQAWAGACALAQTVMSPPVPTFDRLLRDAFDRDFAHRNRDSEPTPRRTGRGR